MELALDTSTRYASVALAREGSSLWELSWRSEQNHTVELAPAVETLLQRARISPGDLKAIIVAQGPGGFSALRVGLSFAKGMAAALGVPLVAVGTLEIEAFPYIQTGLPVCPLLDLGRNEVAWTLFQERQGEPVKLLEESISTLDDVTASVPAHTLFCGEATSRMAAWAQQHRERPRPQVVLLPPPTRRASTLAHLGWLRLARGELDNPATLQPLYMRHPSITMPRGTPGIGTPG